MIYTSDHHGYVLWQLTHVMQQRMSKVLESLDLNLFQVGVLVHISTGENVSTAEIARRNLVSPQNASLTTKKLERLGLVSRNPHPTHGRINLFTLTPDGEKLLVKAVECLQTVEEQMLKDIPKENQANLLIMLKTCLSSFQKS